VEYLIGAGENYVEEWFVMLSNLVWREVVATPRLMPPKSATSLPLN